MNKTQLIYRLSFIFFGVILIGLGIAFLKQSGFGTDPFTAMNLAVSKTLGTSLGIYQLKVNIVLLLIVLLKDRKYIGIGMIINMVCCGFLTEYFCLIIPETSNILLKTIFIIVGVTVVCLGVAFYSSGDFGVAPYDALAWIIEDITSKKLKFKICRIITDAVCVSISLLFGGIVGINTVIMVFFTGPLVEFFRNKISNYTLLSETKINI